jgi:hypothetical protein
VIKMKLVFKIALAFCLVLVLQDVVFLVALKVIGPNAMLSSVLHVKFILYQVMLPLGAVSYGTFQVLASRKDRIRLQSSAS